MRATFKTDLSGFAKELAKQRMNVNYVAPAVLSVVGNELIRWLKSTSAEFGTDADPKNGTPRLLHPGGWGDITTFLRDNYDVKVIRISGGFRLRFSNNAEYAIWVDQHEGRFVLEGVDEIARDEAYKALKLAIPEWDIRLI